MSFDPTGYSPDEPPRSDIPPMSPGGPAPDFSDRSAIQSRVSLPAILLIIAGVINLLWAGYWFFEGIRAVLMTPEQVRETQKATAEALKEFGFPQDAAFAQDPQSVKTQSMATGFGTGIFSLIAGLLTLIGGLRMYQLRSFGLAITGAIAACIPCVSCLGCCGVGEVVGIWAIVVLLNPEVRAAFQ